MSCECSFFSRVELASPLVFPLLRMLKSVKNESTSKSSSLFNFYYSFFIVFFKETPFFGILLLLLLDLDFYDFVVDLPYKFIGLSFTFLMFPVGGFFKFVFWVFNSFWTGDGDFELLSYLIGVFILSDLLRISRLCYPSFYYC